MQSEKLLREVLDGIMLNPSPCWDYSIPSMPKRNVNLLVTNIVNRFKDGFVHSPETNIGNVYNWAREKRCDHEEVLRGIDTVITQMEDGGQATECQVRFRDHIRLGLSELFGA